MQKESREEMAETLMAIAVISKSLAKRIIKGEEVNERDETNTKCSRKLKKTSR